MLSRSGSTLTPGSVTVRPLTEILPPAMRVSASRREATPAAASTFCNRSCITRTKEERYEHCRPAGDRRRHAGRVRGGALLDGLGRTERHLRHGPIVHERDKPAHGL